MAPADHSPRHPGVLVVDDESAVLDLLARALPRHGLRVWAAAGGEEAAALLAAHRGEIDAALLDVRMPGLDGPATLAALRGLRPALPCCFMTGQSGPYADEELLRQGASHVLHKPFQLAEVARVLLSLCGAGG
jgi:CheY-like chemotaxis protein